MLRSDEAAASFGPPARGSRGAAASVSLCRLILAAGGPVDQVGCAHRPRDRGHRSSDTRTESAIRISHARLIAMPVVLPSVMAPTIPVFDPAGGREPGMGGPGYAPSAFPRSRTCSMASSLSGLVRAVAVPARDATRSASHLGRPFPP